MFATIIQQDTPLGIQQVAVVPLNDRSVRLFARTGKNLRGVAGAWQIIDEAPPFVGNAVGDPVSIPLTASDYRDLQYPIIPTTLVQKLVRTVKDANTPGTRSFAEVYDEVYNKALNAPTSLVDYTKAMAPLHTVVAPTIQVLHAPVQEVAPPIIIEAVENVAETVVDEPVMGLLAPSLYESETALSIPDYRPYHSRKFYGLSEVDLFDAARNNQDNVLLTGDAGTGKTSSARNYAHVKGLPFVTIECTQQITDSITQGRFVPTGRGNEARWKYSMLATAVQRPSVVLINEMTRMTPKAASLFLRLLEERELTIEPLNEVIKVHPDCLFIADQNTGLGYTGTSKQDAALVDRFNVKLEYTYDVDIEKHFIPSPTLLQFAENIRSASELSDDYSVPMSTRILKNFVSQAQRLNFEFAVNSMLSNYPKVDGEREAVKMRLDADASSIASELGVPLGAYSTN